MKLRCRYWLRDGRWIGIAISLLVVYSGLICAAVTSRAPAVGGLCGIAAGVIAIVMFLIGHELCHGAYRMSGIARRCCAAVLFMPTLHRPSLWIVAHNNRHHNWVNLAGRDPVYAPVAVDAYGKLSPARRAVERIVRSFPGFVLIYFFKNWLPHQLVPSRDLAMSCGSRSRYRAETVAMIAAATAHMAFLLVYAMYGGGMWTFVIGGAIPWLTWNSLMSWATLLQHTHPSVRWYADENLWQRDRARDRSTVHIVMPKILRCLFLNIMEHGAHHRVPYLGFLCLHELQEERDADPGSIVERASFGVLLAVLRKCRLYDYHNHCWCDWSGSVTTGPVMHS